MTDQQYPIGGFAPGDYFGKCRTCGNQFQGDKRSFQCEPCALKDKQFYDGLSPEQKDRFDKSHNEIVKLFFENLNLKEEKKKEAIAFSEFLRSRYITAIRPYTWIDPTGAASKKFTTEQLYQKFKEDNP